MSRNHARPVAPALPSAARALVALLALAACTPPTQVIQVAPGKEPAQPSFRLPPDAGTVYGLAVVPCGGGSPAWQFGTGGGVTTPIPPTIAYGQLPVGFTLLAGPTPLTPGCYFVYAGTATGRFTVQTGGTVVQAAPARR